MEMAPTEKPWDKRRRHERAARDVGLPTIYEIRTDSFRPATQSDVDNFMAMSRAYGKIRTALPEINLTPVERLLFEAIHTELRAAWHETQPRPET